jgi:uncharacterized protein YggE
MRSALLVLSLGVVWLATACDRGDTTVNAPGADAGGITVSGHGELQAPPDTAVFTAGVQVTSASVADARERAAKAADALIASVKKNGVDEKDLKTTGLSIQPQFDYRTPSEPRITGYQVTNQVTVKVRKLDTVSKVIDDAVAAGGDDVRLQGISFVIDDDEKLLEQAREAAMNDAKAKAGQLARLGGVDLGEPLTIAESGGVTPAQAAKADFAAGTADGVTPIQVGTNTVSIDVSVRWAIKN